MATVKPSPLRKRVLFIRQLGDPHVIPPSTHSRNAGHHWVQRIDFDGRPSGTIVLQWQPVSRRWCLPNDYARGNDYNVEDYVYLAPCPMPLPDADLQKLRAFIADMDEQEPDNSTLAVSADVWVDLRKMLYPLIP